MSEERGKGTKGILGCKHREDQGLDDLLSLTSGPHRCLASAHSLKPSDHLTPQVSTEASPGETVTCS